MAHVESVISTKIKSYNEALYTKLTAMEEYAFEQSDIAKYKPLWKEYSDKWVGYISSISLPESICTSFVLSFYSYCSIQVGFNGATSASFENDSASGVFNGNGLINEVLGRPDNYFNDLVIPPPPLPPEVGPALDPYSPNMELDFPRLESAGEADRVKFTNLTENKYPGVVGKYQMGVLFGNPQPPSATLSKDEMWDLVFDELGWKAFFESIGRGSVVPPRP